MSDLEDLVAGPEPAANAGTSDFGGGDRSPASERKSSLDDLVSRVQTEPSKELLGQLGGIKQREMGETQRAESLASQRRQKDQQQWEQAFDAKAANVNDMPPKWDADGQMEKYSTDPVSAFGSFASVFAIAAAAFTKAPMENALNGSAAAMNAIQAKDEQAYKKAYQAWKDNTDLVVKRGTMMQQDYDNAIRKGVANATVAQAEKLAVAAKYGDERYMALLQGGFAPEAEELLQNRNKSLMGIINAKIHMEQQHDQMQLRREQAEETKRHHLATESAVRGNQMDAERLRIQRDLASADPAVKAKAKQDLEALEEVQSKTGRGGPKGQGGPDAQRREDIYNSTIEEIEKREGRPATADEKKKANDKAYGRGEISANRRDDIRSRYDKASLSIQTMDKAEALMKKHNALPGLGGKLTRPAEAIGNMFGSNETDRAQFARYINELKEWSTLVLMDRAGRPLSAEASKMDSVIAGLSLGDTTANTNRAFKELRELYKTIQKQFKSRIDNPSTWEPDAATGGKPPPKSGGARWWDSAPKVE